MIKALHIEPHRCGPDLRARLAASCYIDYVAVESQASFERALGSKPYEAVFVRLGVLVGRAAFASAPALRWVITPTTGLDHIDLEEAERRGIQVIGLRGHLDFLETVSATAEHTWGLLLALVRHLPRAHQHVMAGEWERNDLLGRQLSGKTLGVVGYGRLGRMVARFGVGFRMRVVAHDIDSRPFERAVPGVARAPLDSLLEESDVLTLHLPLVAETKGFLCADRISRMKRGAILLNTARGELLDEVALLKALESGALGGAALDVLSGDSTWAGRVPTSQSLVDYARRQDNLLLTPHIGGYAVEAIQATREFVAEQFLRAIAAHPIASRG